MARDRLHALDAFRGIAAMWVALYHTFIRYPYFMRGEPTPDAMGWPGFAPIDAGIAPVLVFFVISGFVIVWTVDRCRTPMDFVVSRVSRIYPAYWASILLTVALLAVWPLPNVQLSVVQVLVNVTMLQDYVGVADVTGVYWSLAVEIVYYGYALGLFALGLWRFVHLAAFAWAVAALAAAVLARAGLDVPWRIHHLLLLRFAPELVAGMAMYRMWQHGRSAWPVATLVVAAAAVALNQRPGVTLVCLGAMGLVAWSTQGGLRWLAIRPLTWLGSISYALYLVNEYPAYVVRRALDGAGAPVWAAGAAAVVTGLALATAVSYGVERPAMRLIRAAWRRRMPVAAVATTPGSPG